MGCYLHCPTTVDISGSHSGTAAGDTVSLGGSFLAYRRNVWLSSSAVVSLGRMEMKASRFFEMCKPLPQTDSVESSISKVRKPLPPVDSVESSITLQSSDVLHLFLAAKPLSVLVLVLVLVCMHLMLSSNDPGKVSVDTVNSIALLEANNGLEQSNLFLCCKTSLCAFNCIDIDIAHTIAFTPSPFFNFP